MDKNSGVPLYIQIKESIISEIKNKKLKAGQQMPTERDLAQILRTSRNTVSSAYKLLEQEGILLSHQGRGTFIADDNQVFQNRHLRNKLLNMIDAALSQALEAGFSTDEFLELVRERVSEKEKSMTAVHAVFVECNIEQAKVFAQELSDFTHFTVVPMVLTDIRQRNEETEKKLQDAVIVISTFNHVNEVRELIADLHKDVYGVAVKPCLEGLVRIARLPRETKFGLISLSKEFHHKFERNLISAGLNNLEIHCTTSQEKEEIQNVIDSSDVIIVSPGRCKEIVAIVREQKDVIIFNTTLDLSSVRAMTTKFAETSK